MGRSDFDTHCQALTQAFQLQSPAKTPALLVTLFGDLVESHGGEIWLGSLVALLGPLGVSERLVRTSVYRLTQDNWLIATKQGRRSFYRLTDTARRESGVFERRIYHKSEPDWDGYWRLIFTGTQGIDREQRTESRKRLSKLGFGSIAPNVFGHPTADLEPVWSLFTTLGISDQVVVMRATNQDAMRGLDSPEMVRQCFNLGELDRAYAQFSERYRPLVLALDEGATAQSTDLQARWILRTMLIHQFRRILMRDPYIPRQLLPDSWAGDRARRVLGKCYRAVEADSERYVRALCRNREGLFRRTAPAYRDRFFD